MQIEADSSFVLSEAMKANKKSSERNKISRMQVEEEKKESPPTNEEKSFGMS